MCRRVLGRAGDVVKSIVRDAMWTTAGLLGMSWVARCLSRNRVRILMYHAVVPEDSLFARWTHLPQKSFEWQVGYLKRNYDVRPLSEVVASMRAGKVVAPNTAVLTFDDGYDSVYRRVFPLLQQHGVPASVFLTTHFIDSQQLLWTSRLFLALRATKRTRLSLSDLRAPDADLHGLDFPELVFASDSERDAAADQLREWLKHLPNDRRVTVLAAIEELLGVTQYPDYQKEFSPLTWAQIDEMHQSGLVEFGAHSQTHPILSRLSHPQLQAEVLGSCEVVKNRFGSAGVHFAYPNGGREDFNDDTKIVLERAGADCALSTIEGLCRPGDDLLELRRIGIGSDMTKGRFAAMCSGLESGLKRRMGRL
ncbi:MAG: peptidoglycan/xylan/chitin deacetylase (PgdA/CDA1 family) [Planctomycetota bacterium]